MPESTQILLEDGDVSLELVSGADGAVSFRFRSHKGDQTVQLHAGNLRMAALGAFCAAAPADCVEALWGMSDAELFGVAIPE